MENPADDPRDFSGAAGNIEDPFAGDSLFCKIQLRRFNRSILTLLLHSRSPEFHACDGPTARFSAKVTASGADACFTSRLHTVRIWNIVDNIAQNTSGGSGYTIRINRTSNPGGPTRTTFSSGPIRTDRSGEVPLLSEYASLPRITTKPSTDPINRFVSQNGRQGQDGGINGPLMFQYLLAMLQQPGRRGPMADILEGFMPPGAESGRMGDYVFNQEGTCLLSIPFGVCDLYL